MLESQGVVTIKNDYQDIINAIAKVTLLILFNLSTHTLEMWFIVLNTAFAISLSSEVISFYWFCCVLEYVTDETKPLVTELLTGLRLFSLRRRLSVSVSVLVIWYLVFLLQDIRNQRRYRQRRRQEKKKLGQTLESLQNKSQFYEEQIDYYNQYIRVCLDNLAKKGK